MDATLVAVFFKAALVGLLIAAPVGPIGLLTMQRTLQRGWLAGLATGMGAALADALYGAIGAFGVSWLTRALVQAQTPLALGGGAMLLYLAWKTWRAPVAERVAPASDARDLLGLTVGTFLLTLANPATIISFIAVFGSLGAGLQHAPSPLWMVAGVLAGSAAWWLALTTVIARQRHRVTPAARVLINRASALLLAGFALWQWLSLWRGLIR